jgi:hypothetical protein
MRSRSAAARGRYIELTERVVRPPASEIEPLVVLEKSVAWLELFHLGALTWEYIHRNDIRTLDQWSERASSSPLSGQRSPTWKSPGGFAASSMT